MIDFSTHKAVEVDASSGRVKVQPGATWADVDRATQAFGLVVPGGIVSATGVAGFTLGGGFGWVTRRYGFAADQLAAADVVTADGQVRRASADDNPDLFWAMRGGGGNFGLVTSFEFAARPHGPEVIAGLVLHPMARAKEVLALYREGDRQGPGRALSSAGHAQGAAAADHSGRGARRAGLRHRGVLQRPARRG